MSRRIRPRSRINTQLWQFASPGFASLLLQQIIQIIVCIYVDNSNIFHEGQRYAEECRHEDRYGFRLRFDKLFDLFAQNRPVREVSWGGSIPPPTDQLWQHLENLGIKPDLIPRAASGEHEVVDHLLQLRMHRHVRKYRDDPGTIVLATGDGKGYLQEQGFLYDLEGHVADGWKFEVYSWKHSCHKKLKEFALAKGKFIPLDNYYTAVSFQQRR